MIVLFADSHLQQSAWVGHQVIGDSYFSLQQIVDYAIAEKASAVVGAGDLIDKQRNRSEPIIVFFQQLDRLRSAGIPFYFIEGQHDMDDPPWLSGHAWAQHIHRKSVKVDSLKIYGLNFCTESVLSDELSKVPKGTDILITHQVWTDFMGYVASPQGSFSDVVNASRIFTGDYHKFVLKSYSAKRGSVVVCSPGSTCLQDISEPTDKYFVTFSERDGFKARKLKTRPFIDLGGVTTESEMIQVLEALPGLAVRAKKDSLHYPESVRAPIVYLKYAGVPNVKARIQDVLFDTKHHLFLSEILPEDNLPVIESNTHQFQTLSAALREMVEGDPELLELCQLLLNSEHKQAARDILRETKKRFLEKQEE